MQSFLRQSTASQVRIVGPFLDDTDGKTPETGLTIAGSDVNLMKDGGSSGPSSATVAHESNGCYAITFSATDTNTVGELYLTAAISGARLVTACFTVLEEDIYDAMFADGAAAFDSNGYVIASEVKNLAVGTGGLSTVASGSGVVTGLETLTYAVTDQLDGVYHQVEDVGNATDFYYEFDLGDSGVPQSVEWTGYAQSNGDSYTVHFYNWGATAWEQVGELSAANGTTPTTEQWTATTSHVGTGADVGLTRLRFLSADGTNIATDRILCTFSTVQSGLGFVGGAVWVDTVNGEAGTSGEIGTITRPVDNIANAKTIATSNNLRVFHMLPGSSITLASAFDAYEFVGYGYTVALGGQSVSGTLIQNAAITGNDDGSNASPTVYQTCTMGNNTLGLHRLDECGLSGTITLAEAGVYDWIMCHSRVAGSGAPGVDVGTAIGDTSLNMRRYSGGIELSNMGDTGTDKMSLEGTGQLILGASCSGGSISIRGAFTVTDNASGVVTLSDDARYDVDQVSAGAANAGLATSIALATVGANVSTLLTDHITITASLSGIDSSVGDIKTVTDQLVAAQPEPTGTPASNEAPLDKLGYLFMALRNQVVVTTTDMTFYDDSGTAEWKKSIADVTSVYTESEASAP